MSRWTFKDDSSLPPPPPFKGGPKKYASGSETGTELHFELASDHSSRSSTELQPQVNSHETSNYIENSVEKHYEKPDASTKVTSTNQNYTPNSEGSVSKDSYSKHTNENGYPNGPSLYLRNFRSIGVAHIDTHSQGHRPLCHIYSFVIPFVKVAAFCWSDRAKYSDKKTSATDTKEASSVVNKHWKLNCSLNGFLELGPSASFKFQAKASPNPSKSHVPTFWQNNNACESLPQQCCLYLTIQTSEWTQDVVFWHFSAIESSKEVHCLLAATSAATTASTTPHLLRQFVSVAITVKESHLHRFILETHNWQCTVQTHYSNIGNYNRQCTTVQTRCKVQWSSIKFEKGANEQRTRAPTTKDHRHTEWRSQKSTPTAAAKENKHNVDFVNAISTTRFD
jgi:hypothetical protein